MECFTETLNSVQRSYWIVRGRETVKRVIRKCVTCHKGEGQPYSAPVLPDLPEERVSEGPPFFNTGIDFAGPLYVKDSKAVGSQSKVYICLFTCTSTRAVHLELTADLTSTAFLLAFRRFTSRRGLPAVVITDNAKTFKSASSDVKKIVRSQEVQQYMVNHQAQWSLIWRKPLGGEVSGRGWLVVQSDVSRRL